MAEVGDIYEYRIVCTWGSQTSINVRHYRCTAKEGTGAADIDHAVNLDVALAPSFKSILSAAAVYRGISAQKIRPVPPSLPAYTIASMGVGSQAGDPLPGQLCGLINLRTNYSGPRYRGRLYFPFPVESQNAADGRPVVAYIAALDAIGAILNQVRTPGPVGNMNTMVPCIFSRKYETTADVRYVAGRSAWATQRRRGNFGDENPPPF